MADQLQGVVRELEERYPLLKGLAFASAGALPDEKGLPAFLAVLLSTAENRETGASCILLPSTDRLCVALALIYALNSFKQGFDELELDRLTTPLRPGTLVVVAPENCVFELIRDGVQLYGKRWIQLRNPVDDQISYMPSEEAFRLTPTTSVQPRPRKGQRPGKWITSPLDVLLGVRTSGNLAVESNRIILVSGRADTLHTAASTLVAGEGTSAVASELVSWGRVTSDGRVVSDGIHGEPMIAVTHSVEYAAAACQREGVATKLVIADGARRLAANLQAFDDISLRHRLLVIAAHAEKEHADILAERGCEMWAPDPEILMLGDDGNSSGMWFSAAMTAARNYRDLRLVPVSVRDCHVEALYGAVAAVPAPDDHEGDTARLSRMSWSLLLTVTGWLGSPASSARELIDRRIEEIRQRLSTSRSWIPRDMAQALEEVIAAARTLRDADDVGIEKREALIDRLRHDGAGVITRTVTDAVHTSDLLRKLGITSPVFPITGLPLEPLDRIVLCAWPGRLHMTRLTNWYGAREISILTYPFELEWFRPFSRNWSAGWQRHAGRREEIAALTGISGWTLPAREGTVPHTAPAPPDDPVTRLLRQKRKARDVTDVSIRDAREAHYVGFQGDAYAFLSEGHRVPVLTDLILTGRLSGERIPLKTVRKLAVGDFILFRDQGDQDVVSAIAEQEMGTARYRQFRQTADLWRTALASLGEDVHAVWRRLRREGLNRSRAAVRGWLNGDRIAPRSEQDLRIIAQVSQDADLLRRFDEVSDAVRTVWAAHIRAGFALTELLLRELPQRLGQIDEGGAHVQFTFGGGWIVCVDEIAERPETRPYWEVNRLLMDDDA